jgi:hypothetical protein
MPEWEHICDRCGSPTDCADYPDGDSCIYCGKWFCGNCIEWDVPTGGPVCKECALLYASPGQEGGC